MDAKQALHDEIKSIREQILALEKQIEARQAALRTLQKSEGESGSPHLRFYMMRPIDAIRLLLVEHGGKMKREDAYKELLQGGIALDRKRRGANVRISFDKNVALGNLIALPDDYIALPPESPSK
jgi:hypothetical protein